MTWDEAYMQYDEWLNATGTAAKIQIPGAPGSVSFTPSQVLRECSPGSYVDLFNDWADGSGIDTDELEGTDRYA